MLIHADGVFVRIDLSGRVYVEEAMKLREQAFQHLDQGCKTIVINLSGVDYMDSSGLGAIISVHKHALQKGGRMTVKGLRGEVKELFELTKLGSIVNIEA